MNDSSSNFTSQTNSVYPVVTTTFLQGITDQNAEAWQRLVRIYGPVVFYWCRQKGARDEDAADIGQEVFRAVLLGIHRFERSRQNAFLSWLKTITRNKICDFWRRKSQAPDVVGGTDFQEIVEQTDRPILAPEINASDDVNSIIVRQTLNELRASFSDKTWKAFWETSVNNRISNDVAEDLGLTPMAVRKAKSRVLRQLRLQLEAEIDLNGKPNSKLSHPDD